MTRLTDMPPTLTGISMLTRKFLDNVSPLVSRIGGADVRELRRRVLCHCLGDKLQAERFVQYERWLDPDITEREALRRAVRTCEQGQR